MKSLSIKLFDICNIYMMIWVLWQLVDVFVTNGLLSMSLFIPYFVITIFYIIKVFSQLPPKGAMRALCLFFAVLMIYGFVLLILDDVKGQDRKSFIMMLMASLGPVFPSYYFSKKGYLTEKRITGWLIVFMIMAFVLYKHNQMRAIYLMMELGRNYEEVTNNSSYLFVGLFPFVFLLWKKPLLQYIYLAVLIFFIVTGYKRGAMLTGAFLLVWFVYVSIKISTKGRKTLLVLLTTIAVVVGYYYIIQFYENSDYLQYRLEKTQEGDSSQRDVIYNTLWNHFIDNDNVFNIIFGEGAYHTETILGLKAHNDWLELLIDCGILGLIIYVYYWLCFVIDWRKSKHDFVLYSMMGACFIYAFVRSFFSMSFSEIPFYTSLVIGYCFARADTTNFQLIDKDAGKF